ncbi:MAG: SPOR domain-containing protein [Candidatus Omnitrophota bacterium]
MNINYKEAQFEFFPNEVSKPDETKRPHFMAARFNVSIENLVIFSIVSIMVVIFTFSLGVERGKRVALRDGAAQVIDDKVQAVPAVLSSDPSVAKGQGFTTKTMTKVTGEIAQVKGSDASLKVPATALPPQEAVGKPASGYTVQVASYKSEKSAQKEVLALQKKGFQAFTLPKGQHIVLCVGNFQKREEASLYGKKLKGHYQDYVVRRL